MYQFLVVDDDIETHAIVRQALEPLDYQVTCAADGAEALKLAHRTAFDAILVELRLPQMSGRGFLRRLERSDVAVPIVVMGSQIDTDVVIDVMRHGARDFLHKPLDRSDVIAAVDRLLSRRRVPTAELVQPPAASIDEDLQLGEREAATTSDPDRPETTDRLFKIRTQLQDGTLRLPVMGPVLEGMLELTRAPLASSAKVLKLVGREPAIAAAILKAANSAFYGGLEPVRSLNEAAIRLGNKEVLNLANTVLLSDFFSVSGHVYQALLQAMWKNTLACAYHAQLVAARISANAPERAYMAGLFHNIGEALLIRISAEIHPADELDDDSLNALSANLRIFHGEFGSSLLRAWKSDSQLVALALHHHTPERFVAEQRRSEDARVLVAAVNIGYELALEAGHTYLGNSSDPDDLAAQSQTVGISREQLNQIKEQVGQAVDAFD